MPPLLLIAGALALLWLFRRGSDGMLTRNIALREFIVSASYPELLEEPTPTQLANVTRGAPMLQRIRDAASARRGFDTPLTINSGFRWPRLTAALGGSSSSRGHQYGNAADIQVATFTNHQLQRLVHELYQAGELPELDQSITYTDTTHLHVGWGQPPRGQFMLASRNPDGSRRYDPWSPS